MRKIRYAFWWIVGFPIVLLIPPLFYFLGYILGVFSGIILFYIKKIKTYNEIIIQYERKKYHEF